MPKHPFRLHGEQVTVEAADGERPLWVLRDLLGVTGPTHGCGINVSKACTSRLNGRAVNPCAVRVSALEPGDEITTIEGLADTVDSDLHPMQQARLDQDVAQCGYCQPGQIMAAVALVRRVAEQSREITEADLDGIRNICRCGTYPRIRAAIRAPRREDVTPGAWQDVRTPGQEAAPVPLAPSCRTAGTGAGPSRPVRAEPDGGTVLMPNYDVKKERRDLYGAKHGRFDIVDVPRMAFLMADGRGNPNTSPDYRALVEALYTTAYSVRALAKRELGRTHTVGPLEGLWSADDLGAFKTRDHDAWIWTLMIVQPDWVTTAMAEEAKDVVRRTKDLAAGHRVRFEDYAEGQSVQTLHIGPYDAEGPTIARMHDEFMPAGKLVPRGHHHEIYLSDARRTEPGRLRTILRQPVGPAHP